MTIMRRYQEERVAHAIFLAYHPEMAGKGGDASPYLGHARTILGAVDELKAMDAEGLKAGGSIMFPAQPPDGTNVVIGDYRAVLHDGKDGTVARGATLAETLENLATFLNDGSVGEKFKAVVVDGNTLVLVGPGSSEMSTTDANAVVVTGADEEAEAQRKLAVEEADKQEKLAVRQANAAAQATKDEANAAAQAARDSATATAQAAKDAAQAARDAEKQKNAPASLQGAPEGTPDGMPIMPIGGTTGPVPMPPPTQPPPVQPAA